MRQIEHIRHHKHTRSGIVLPEVRGIVLHWPEWPGADAQRLRDYLDTLPETEPAKYASYHYAVGLGGQVLELIPPTECAWHAGPTAKTRPEVRELLGGAPNWRTLGVALCHPSADGAYLRATWTAAAQLVGELMRAHQVPINRVLRHHDCTGKDCPRWFVRNDQDWISFKREIIGRM